MPLFRMLGRLEIVVGDTATPIAGVMAARCAAALLLDTNRQVPLRALLDFLWDDPPVSARQNLRNYVTQVRRTLDDASPGMSDRIGTWRSRMGRGGGYRLEAGPDEVDVHQFRARVQQAKECRRRGDLDAACALLGQATALWQGSLDGTLGGTRTASARLVHLEEEYLCALEEQLELRTCLEGPSAPLAELRRCARAYPLRERPTELLVRSLYLLGDVSAALAELDRHRGALAHSLGVGASPRLRRLYAQVVNRDDAALRPTRYALVHS